MNFRRQLKVHNCLFAVFSCDFTALKAKVNGVQAKYFYFMDTFTFTTNALGLF